MVSHFQMPKIGNQQRRSQALRVCETPADGSDGSWIKVKLLFQGSGRLSEVGLVLVKSFSFTGNHLDHQFGELPIIIPQNIMRT